MKVTNWRRTLAASLLAGGLLSPSAAYAANLNTNLVPDPQFDMLTDPPVQCCFGAKFQLESWNDGTQRGFAYDNSVTFYDSGGPLAGGGIHYFSSAVYGLSGDDPDITMPGQVSENIDVSTGATLTQIDSGEAVVRLSAFFTSYGSGQSTHNTEGDLGFVHVDFLDDAASSLGTAQISRRQPTVNGWDQNAGVFPIPVGTRMLKASLYGAAATTGPDAYIDVVDVQVREADDELIFLEVNTVTGQVAIKNETGDPVNLDYYKITSTGGSALNATDWNSLQEQDLPGFPAGDGSGDGWEQFGGGDLGIVGESYLSGNSTVADSASIGLGAAFNVGGAHDLEFVYSVVPPGAGGDLDGDYDDSNLVSQGDLDLVLLNWGDAVPPTPPGWVNQVPTDGLVSQNELDGVLLNWGDAGGSSGTGQFVTGFVRYVGGASTASAVPEPSSVLLVGIGIASLAVGRWPKTKRDDSAEMPTRWQPFT